MMTGLVRKATLLSVCGLLGASAVMAGVPNAGNSSIGSGIILVGTAGGVADVKGQKLIVVRDALNQPVQNSTVTINFSAAANGSDIRLCSTQPFAGVGVSCGNKEVVALTDATGTATFRVVGHALNPGGGTPGAPAPGFGAGAATVKADGVSLGTLTVATADENGAQGCNTVDLALMLNDNFSDVPATAANERGRSDYNADGKVNVVDVALFLNIKNANGSTASCAVDC
jgi:hypothetical protein